jgi:hypothetical protein
MQVSLLGRLQAAFGSLGDLSCARRYPDNRGLTLAEFTEINRPETGILVKQVADWYSSQDIASIKDAYPQPERDRHGKIVVFSSEPGEADHYFKVYPEYRAFYQCNDVLRGICERMRREILASLPADERGAWEAHKWVVAVQWSNGSEPLVYDHIAHVHRDSIVASLTMEGSGTIARIPQQDISKLDCNQICHEAGNMGGYIYQAAAGELMIIKGVHYPCGGLHAAPHRGDLFPSRLTILVSISL